ncbi:MAG: PhzF family phenazine biosynthesis protein [Pseudanabaenaceae cyanobacterium bins.68]|nr:PhzF family phenazine biosynthesis protein [Pseudanabaenaceae cyanobacterium bins.68]
MEVQIYTVDAFTRVPFQGNPAAVTVIKHFPSDRLMQQIAAELNLSETAFAQELSPNHFHLRWFTPQSEVELCGHATLAMSHFLRETGRVDPSYPLIFQTLGGTLTVEFEHEQVVMDFPANFPVPCHARTLDQLAQLFTTEFEVIGRTDNITVRLLNEQAVANFVPNFEQINQLEIGRLCLTAIADPGKNYDFVSRFFAPAVGINEDPVTGSAHCTLAPYWSQVLNQNPLRAWQLSPRGGELTVAWQGDRVKLIGCAVSVLRGTLILESL